MIGNLGFGCMRLPVLKSGEIDHEQFCEMVDLFLEKGFTYFDTSYMYHNGKSEAAVREALVKRHPRDSFTLATKFPTMILTSADKEKVVPIFEEQLKNCGVEYFDYYMLHNLNRLRYENVVKPCKLFEFIVEKKKAGVIKNIGFSFHDSAEVLDKILSEHPEVDFVQIVLNYFDWTSYVIQAEECYKVIRKHGKKVVGMETVKGGMLAKVPSKAKVLMDSQDPTVSEASWAVRYAAGKEGVISVLSGMSNYEQAKDNTSTMQDFKPLTKQEENMLMEVAEIIRKNGPVHTADFSKYKHVSQHDLPVAAILDTWTAMVSQANPSFSAEGNYYKLLRAQYHAPEEGEWVKAGLTLSDGTDITDLVREADHFVQEHSF